MKKYNLREDYYAVRDDYIKTDRKNFQDDSGLVSVLDEPIIIEPIDEPVPEVIDSCCCPCPPKTTAIPFVAFGPLQ